MEKGMVLYLDRTDLRTEEEDKELEDITYQDMRRPLKEFFDAHLAVFRDGDKFKVLKNRYPFKIKENKND